MRRRVSPGSSSGPASTRWASPRAAERAGPWPSGSSRVSRPATSWPSTSGASPRSTQTIAGCATGSVRSWACTTPCRGPTASSPRRGPSVGHRCISSWPTRAPCSVRRWGGSGRTSSHRRECRPTSTTPGVVPPGWHGRAPSNGRHASRWRCSTKRRSASCWWSVGTARRCSSACARPTSRSKLAGPSTPACSMSTPGTKPT